MADEDVKPDRLKTSKTVAIAVKLNGTNYAIWSRLMKIATGSRRAYGHITGSTPALAPEEKGFAEWEETNLIVFSWILDNIETDLVFDFTHHQSAKALWDSLAVTFQSTSDPYLIYDLKDKANRIVQGELSLETYWRHLHGMRIDIDRCSKRPITCCDKGVEQYMIHSIEERLIKFLTGLDKKYEGIRRDILKESLLPSAEVAYSWVKREAARLKIHSESPDPAGATNRDLSQGGVGFGLATRNQYPQYSPTPQQQIHTPHRPGQPPNRSTATPQQNGGTIDKSKMWCSNCGKNGHVWGTCFRRIAFPSGGTKRGRQKSPSE